MQVQIQSRIDCLHLKGQTLGQKLAKAVQEYLKHKIDCLV